MKRTFLDANTLNRLFPSINWTASPYKEKLQTLDSFEETYLKQFDDYDPGDLQYIATVLFFAALQLDNKLTATKNVSLTLARLLTEDQKKYLDTLYHPSPSLQKKVNLRVIK